MDELIQNELMPMGTNRPPANNTRVLWEENKLGKGSITILDILVPTSSLTLENLSNIKHQRKINGRCVSGNPYYSSRAGNQHSGNSNPFRKSKINGRCVSGIPYYSSRAGNQHSGNSNPFRKSKRLKRSESGGNVEDDSMMETYASGSWSFSRGEKGSKADRRREKESTDEKNWERLLRTILFTMRSMISEGSKDLPFGPDVLSNQRYWSSQFANTPIEDSTDSQEPDLVLLDYGLKSRKHRETLKTSGWSYILTGIEITRSELAEVGCHNVPVFFGVATKGYLILQHQPWRRFVLLFSIANSKLRAHYLDHSGMIISNPVEINSNPVRFVDVLNSLALSDLPSLGLDPTIHVCNILCSATVPHNHANEPPGGVNNMPAGAKGWVMDNTSKVYWIMDVLWKSHGLISRGTVCYRVQDEDGKEYALKDCWVDEEKKDHGVELLEKVKGIPNVVYLERYWDVEYQGRCDNTSWVREHFPVQHLPLAPIYCKKIHRRMLLTPCGLPLTSYTPAAELVSVFQDFVVGHEEMVKRNVLHGDLSPNNFIIYKGKGYFIDFDHAKLLTGNVAITSHGTGTIPYMSSRLLCLMGTEPSVPGGEPPLIDHRPADDLESLFYIFLDFAIKYGGPQGKVNDNMSVPQNMRMWQNSYISQGRDGLKASGYAKKFFLNGDGGYVPTAYFKGCLSILEDWRKALSNALRETRDISHPEVLEILQRNLTSIQARNSLISPSIASSSALSVAVPPLPPPIAPNALH